jgi:DNA helicase-2/ATP-dependent DNA helicase PcrA
MNTKHFDELYKKLNLRQREAVDAIEGPVMVVAGPGTGKTQILTLRIANILKKTDTPPDAILALTFTEAGVAAMRKRLVEIIGSSAYRVGIFTFHSFCNDIIKRFPEQFPRIIGSINISDIDKISVIKELLDNGAALRGHDADLRGKKFKTPKIDLKILRPYGDTFYYLHPVRQKISELKRENISPDDLELKIKKLKLEIEAIPDLHHEKGAYKGKIKGKYESTLKNIEKLKELLKLYRAYEKVLEERKLYDYEDMILEVIRALEEDEAFRLQVQEEYQYVLADEHQDANNAQNRVLELLTSFHQNPNLFIVGDEKQAIFRFQGASLENFQFFQKKFPKARMIILEDNYRSTQTILDAAHSLLDKK